MRRTRPIPRQTTSNPSRPAPHDPVHRQLAQTLLAWFRTHARDLPWRKTRDPYAIWISEVMLQQTRVQTVIPYWIRWMKTLPTVRSLARAKPDQVLKLWEGLGYYSRARNLHRAAAEILRRFHGRIPADPIQLLSLPGVGPYTAGAIRSIAFNHPTPAIDGNVLRVLARAFGIAGNPKTPPTRTRLESHALALIQFAAAIPTHPGRLNCADFNQALMELGAVVCTPTKPGCPTCPWSRTCLAHRTRRTHLLPTASPRVRIQSRRLQVSLIPRKGRFLLLQRPTHLSRGGLWQFPQVETASSRAQTPHMSAPLFQLTHCITRYRYQVHVYSHESAGTSPDSGWRQKWLTPEQIERTPLTGLSRKVWNRCRSLPRRKRCL